jgi:hypothetical protein
MDRRWPRTHRHAAVPGLTPLVKVGVPVVRPMAAIQVDRQDLQDRRALRLERREEIGPHEDVIEVVVQHVQVVEDCRRLGEVPSKVGRGLGHHWHKLPLDRRPTEVSVVERDDLWHQLLLSLRVAEQLSVVDRRLQPVIRPDLRVELPELVTERLGLREAPERAVMIETVWRDGFRLLQVVREEFAIRRLLVPDLVTREQVVEAAMEDVCPVERLRHLPR